MRKNIVYHIGNYIRLSKEDGDKEESDSVGNQKLMLSNFVKKQEDFILYREYVDDGFTGTNFKRPAFEEMIRDIEEGHINCIVVKDLSRFGRDYIDTGRYLERYFPEMGVRFIAINDNIDSAKQIYDMLLPIKNIFNEQYARDISKKVQSSFKTKQNAGEFVGAFASYGYKKSMQDRHKLIIDEYPASVVRKIFNMYIGGSGKVRIAHILNKEDVLCPSAYKKANGEKYINSNKLETTSYWTYSTINGMLQNQMYIGNMIQGKTKRRMKGKAQYVEKEDWIVVEKTHEAIIDVDVWDKVQTLLKKNTRELDLNSNQSIFAGFLKCGDCGRAMTKKNSGKYTKYYCGTYVRSGSKYCLPHAISHKILEEIVLGDLKVIVGAIDNLQELAEKNKEITTSHDIVLKKEILQLENDLLKIQKLKKEIYSDFKEDLISKEEYINYRQDYVEKELLWTKKIKNLNEMCLESKEIDILEMPWLRKLLKLRVVDQLDRDIIIEMIDTIHIYNDQRIKIIYNFSDELEHLYEIVYNLENR